MELLKGNLLLLLTIVSHIAFATAFANLYDGPFRRIFELYRKKNMYYECKIVGSLILGTSIICSIFYQLLCMLFQYKGVSFLSIIFVLLALFTFYLLISYAALKNAVSVVLNILSGMVILATLLIIFIIRLHIHLDQYYGYATLILGLLDILLFPKWLNYWKRGDVF